MSSSDLLRLNKVVLAQAKATLSTVSYAANTMYLFNKSDIKTIVFPITIFAQALAGFQSWTRFALVVVWVWLELLEFTVSNQTFGDSPEEDALNKPFRPIPAKRLTLEQAKTLRLCMTPLNLIVGFALGTLPATIGISLFTPLHNEGGGHNHWLTKGGITAILYALFEMGATNIAEGQSQLTQNQVFAILGSSLIIFTTIHAQDFRDMKGDAPAGRKTFPLVWQRTAVYSMLVGPIFWSIVLALFSRVHFVFLAALLVESAIVGSRFFRFSTPEAHRKSYLHYNIWLCLVHIVLSGVDISLGASRLAAAASLLPALV